LKWFVDQYGSSKIGRPSEEEFEMKKEDIETRKNTQEKTIRQCCKE
jgi:hypothetical protein